MYDASDEAITTRLEELQSLETVPAFSQAFYGVIAELLTEVASGAGVRLAYAGLLDVELRYHRALQTLAEREEVSLQDLRSARDKHRIGLESIREFASRVADGEAAGTRVQQLVLAQCYYHLRRTEAAIAALERAIQCGATTPLVHFALGYNRYALALETCTEAGAEEGEVVVRDPLSFQVQCLRAVSAFENGLNGSDLDEQLYWWIGTVLEAAGLTDAAQDAYDKSTALSAEECDAETQETAGQHREQNDGDAITEEEVRMAGELLKGSFSPTDILGDDD